MPSRRELIALSDAEIDDYLAASRTLIIVSNGKDGFPHPMPMWFFPTRQRTVRCTTFRKSQKVLNFQRDPRATLLVESGEEYARLKGVVIYARAAIVDETDAVVAALIDINTRGQTISAEDRRKLSDSVLATAEKRVLIEFTPERYVSWDHGRLGGRY